MGIYFLSVFKKVTQSTYLWGRQGAGRASYHVVIDTFDYRPQLSCEGYVFTGVCLSKGGRPREVWGGDGCLSACWDTTPPGADTPQEQTPPKSRHPPEQTPPGQTPPKSRPPKSRHPQGRHPPKSRHPPRADPPPPDTATAADGTHPTGMHACWHM